MKMVLALMLGLALGAGAAQAGRIKQIVVENNTKTTDETVILIAGIAVGDHFTPNMVEHIQADLVGSGLFQDVFVLYQVVQGGYRVIISAKDKHSWVIAPTYYNQPTNMGGGVGFGENNLFGENKKLLLYGQIATGDSFFIGAYIDPSILGTRFKWQLDTYLLRERVIEYTPPAGYFDTPQGARISKLNYLNVGTKAGLKLFRGASFDVRLRGAKVFYDDTQLAEGAQVSDVTTDPAATPETIPDPGAEGYDVSTEILLEYDTRANWYGIRHGNRYRLSYERALPQLGSEFDYWYATARFERARKYFERHNLILRAMVGHGRDLPFHQEYSAGGTDLRGFKNDQFRGDFKAAMNIEYSVPVVTIKGVALRLVGFTDTSYTTFLDADPAVDTFRNYLPGHSDDRMAPLKNTVGLGTRLYVRQIVLPLLGLDVGYGIERKDWEIYLAIGLTDT
jgi:outer membrane protein insertion porin family